jgi:RNA recognition motif-containing protein
MVDGKPRGAGTVLFDSPDAAAKAIQTFNSAQLDGRIITVKLDRKAN